MVIINQVLDVTGFKNLSRFFTLSCYAYLRNRSGGFLLLASLEGAGHIKLNLKMCQLMVALVYLQLQIMATKNGRISIECLNINHQNAKM
jgi:hypothetical protein